MTSVIIEKLFYGTAWLSSVRAVGCNIKLFNERNPCTYIINVFFFNLKIYLKYKAYLLLYNKIRLDEVKSLWSKYIGLHTRYKNKNRKILGRNL